MPTNVIATQDDNPGAEDWRPEPTKDSSREKSSFLDGWKENGTPVKGKSAPVVDDDSDLEDRVVDDDDDDADDDDDEVDAVESGGAKPKRAAVDDDEDEDEEEADDDAEEKDEDADPDADLDDDEEKDEKDPKIAQGLAKLQRQEKRQREQIDRERESARAELTHGRQQLEETKAEIAKAKAKYDSLAERAQLDPLGVLEELGVVDDDFVGKQAYARVKAKTDPAFREAAAKMKADRTIRAELDALKAKDAEREKEVTETKKHAEQRQAFDHFVGSVLKEAKSFKAATLTNLLLASDPDEAKVLFARAGSDLWSRNGAEPSPIAVLKHAEKMQRAQLRKYRIDPRSLASLAAVSGEGEKTTAIAVKPNGKPAKGKAKVTLEDELRRPTRDELINEDWTSGRRTR